MSEPYCYSKRPSRRFQKADIELPPPPDLVFTVSINRDERGFVILDWEMRKAHPIDGGHPLGWETDFEERLWPNP